MSRRFNGALTIIVLSALAGPFAVRAQGSPRISDSLLLTLRPRQEVRIRLSGGSKVEGKFARIDPTLSRVSIDGYRPTTINVLEIDSLHEQAGSRAKAGAATGAIVLGVLFGGALSSLACVDGCAESGTNAFLAGGAVGVALGGLVGFGIGSQLQRWNFKYGRPKTASVNDFSQASFHSLRTSSTGAGR